jgi:hypothetical protein
VPEFDIKFARRLCDAADLVSSQGLEPIDAKRTVLYLSLLSVEIALKAGLEKAGQPVPRIVKRSHDLRGLLDDIANCSIIVAVTPQCTRRVKATQIYAKEVSREYSNATVGHILSAQRDGASKYPTQIRYGSLLKHYPVDIMLRTAAVIIEWVDLHWGDLKVIRAISEKDLLAENCSLAFSKRALVYSPLYEADISVFIATIESILGVSRAATESDFEAPLPKVGVACLDYGNMEVERDYNGDNLTSLGYRP